MVLLTDAQRTVLESVSSLGYCNPFLPERVEHERAVLGPEFVEGEPVWSYRIEQPGPRENVWRIYRKLEPLAEELRSRLSRGARARDHDLVLYEDAILHLLYTRYYQKFYEAAFEVPRSTAGRWRFYADYRADWSRYFEIQGVRLPTGHDPQHTFACFRQIQRAFEYVFRDIIGNSLPAARLRAGVWQSIFTHDMRRYRRTLYARMGEFATLITGPSGTGKELAARAIAESRYTAFDAGAAVLRRRRCGILLPHQHLGPLPDPGGIRAFRPQARRLHGRRGRSQRMARNVSRLRLRFPRRAGRPGPRHSSEAPARHRDPHLPLRGGDRGPPVSRQADHRDQSRPART